MSTERVLTFILVGCCLLHRLRRCCRPDWSLDLQVRRSEKGQEADRRGLGAVLGDGQPGEV